MTEVVLASCSGGIVNLTLIEDLRGDTVRGDAKELADIALFEDRAGVRPTKTQYDADFEAAFATGRSLWSAHADELQEGMDPSRLRERLLGPFLSLLGYDLQYQRSHLSAGEESFRITHLGWDGGDAPPMILDPLPPDSRGERQRRSAHDEMQAYLNESPRHTWGIVSDGRVLRIVRDFHHTRTKGYVEFELAHIFEAGSVADFLALFRVCHSSRFRRGRNSMPRMAADPKIPTICHYWSCCTTARYQLAWQRGSAYSLRFEEPSNTWPTVLWGPIRNYGDECSTKQDSDASCTESYSQCCIASSSFSSRSSGRCSTATDFTKLPTQ